MLSTRAYPGSGSARVLNIGGIGGDDIGGGGSTAAQRRRLNIDGVGRGWGQRFRASLTRSSSTLRRFSGLFTYSFAFSASWRPFGLRVSSLSLVVSEAITLLLPRPVAASGPVTDQRYGARWGSGSLSPIGGGPAPAVALDPSGRRSAHADRSAEPCCCSAPSAPWPTSSRAGCSGGARCSWRRRSARVRRSVDWPQNCCPARWQLVGSLRSASLADRVTTGWSRWLARAAPSAPAWSLPRRARLSRCSGSRSAVSGCLPRPRRVPARRGEAPGLERPPACITAASLLDCLRECGGHHSARTGRSARRARCSGCPRR